MLGEVVGGGAQDLQTLLLRGLGDIVNGYVVGAQKRREVARLGQIEEPMDAGLADVRVEATHWAWRAVAGKVDEAGFGMESRRDG